MTLRVATFNVENLFTRPAAMADGSGDRGQAAIDAHAELNAIVRKPSTPTPTAPACSRWTARTASRRSPGRPVRCWCW
jgi:hypothetical protein